MIVFAFYESKRNNRSLLGGFMIKTFFIFSLIVVSMIAGCKSYNDYQQDRIAYAVEHFDRAKRSNVDETQTFTLKECIRLALRNNVDLRVLNLEEQVVEEMHTSEMLGMLPELTISNEYLERSNVEASRGKNVYPDKDGGTHTYSQREDQQLNLFNIDLAFSVLDFGLAFFNSQQAKDRVFLRRQRVRRIEQNLVLEVVQTYFKVAVAQRAKFATEQLLKDCRNRMNSLSKMAKQGMIAPYRAFEETQKLVDIEKRLTNYFRHCESYRVELCALLGLYADTKIKVDHSMLDTVPNFTFPEMELMEQIALMRRPELFEVDIQKHINHVECYKSILMMFPNVRLFADFKTNNSDFQYHTSWWEVGIRAAYNLLKLPQNISRYRTFSKQVDVDKERTFAQSIAIIAQVRMAHANLLAMKAQLDMDSRVQETYKENLMSATAVLNKENEIEKLEQDLMRLACIEKNIEREISLSNYYVSYFRILNSLGVENLEPDTVRDFREALSYQHVLNAGNFMTQKREYYTGDYIVKYSPALARVSRRVGGNVDDYEVDTESQEIKLYSTTSMINFE